MRHTLSPISAQFAMALACQDHAEHVGTARTVWRQRSEDTEMTKKEWRRCNYKGGMTTMREDSEMMTTLKRRHGDDDRKKTMGWRRSYSDDDGITPCRMTRLKWRWWLHNESMTAKVWQRSCLPTQWQWWYDNGGIITIPSRQHDYDSVMKK